MALGHLDELQKAEKYLIRWSLYTGFTVCVEFKLGRCEKMHGTSLFLGYLYDFCVFTSIHLRDEH